MIPVLTQYLGLDIGRDSSHPATALIQRIDWPQINDHRLIVKNLQRLPLHLSYPELIERVETIIRRLRLQVPDSPHLVVDATGVGSPLIDQFKRMRERVRVTPVLITSGSTTNDRRDGTTLVPRKDLLTSVKLALEKGKLFFAARLENRDALVQEMLNLNEDGTRFSTSEHDDLIMAVALATHRATRWITL